MVVRSKCDLLVLTQTFRVQSQTFPFFESVPLTFQIGPSHFFGSVLLIFRVRPSHFFRSVVPSFPTDGSLSVCALWCTFLVHFFPICYSGNLCFFMLYFFHVALFSCCTFLILKKQKMNERQKTLPKKRHYTQHRKFVSRLS